MGKTFQKITASSTGSFGADGNKISQWIIANGGQYTREVDNRTTHLITTQDAYKRNTEIIQRAKQLGTVKIVTFDWLEDSLSSKTRTPKREGPYLLEKIISGEKRKAEEAEKPEKPVKRARGRPAKPVASKKPPARAQRKMKKATTSDPEALGYHVYTDVSTGAAYSAILTRPMPSKRSREKFLIKVYESNSEPQVYATYSKYSRIGQSKLEYLAPLKSTIGDALVAFEEFFEAKTGFKWENRSSEENPPPPNSPEGWFCYEDRSLLSNFLRQAPAIEDQSNEHYNDNENDNDKQEDGSGLEVVQAWLIQQESGQ